ncbi:cis-prenyltransferase [Dimargaris cristalligena]|uniref:Alkyl transferase n=1 Tax=Dimargaris cristalligena TaxID=215637 RepID=A0A4P9ZUQ0_9FUNG|nr:cis-prenyltransferase [Dimargaris cristalligena]RKP36532.1 dehydrodolichyl diphosphate synthetase [Dimargaris cristalligena]|eukprot:RKP36532.1 dehydrodolichyl diphosphate synthetase [Dimargaris cristalligena]
MIAVPAIFQYLYTETNQRLRRLFMDVLRQGPIPRHAAFIMDGNRRYARNLGVATQEGHLKGFRKLEEVLEWCMQLGIPAVSIYAFSIDNFNRPPEEVDTLMKMAKEKLVVFCRESETVRKYGINVRVCGNLKLLSPEVRAKVDEVHEITKNNNKAILNVCFAYNSSDEIATAMRRTIKDTTDGSLATEAIQWKNIEDHLFTADSPPLDILIRTSGENRFSDFLLCQIAKHCSIHFTHSLWPEFTLWDLLKMILEFQVTFASVEDKKM